MTDADAVVVVIPFHNGMAFIERAVRSVLDQTHPAHEIVVVDDGSTEAEAQGLTALASTLGFSVIRQDNAGQSVARNTGVAHSSSPLICLLDQDDFFLPDHIEQLLAIWNSHRSPSVGYVYGDTQRVDLNGDIVYEHFIKSHSTHPKVTMADFLTSDMYILPSASLFSRDMFDAIGGFHPELRGYEDDDFFLRAQMAGFRGIFLDRPVVAWTFNPGSSSHSPTFAASRMVYLRRVTAILAGLSDTDKRELAPHFYPRFVSQIAYDLSALRAAGKEHDLAEARLREALMLYRESGTPLPINTRLVIGLMAVTRSLPDPMTRIAMSVALSRPLRRLRSALRR
jgi:glycosyltransferase involved in cell wall biosynthesis